MIAGREDDCSSRFQGQEIAFGQVKKTGVRTTGQQKQAADHYSETAAKSLWNFLLFTRYLFQGSPGQNSQPDRDESHRNAGGYI